METYLNQAPCLYFSYTDDGILIEVNETLCRLLGFAKEELLGKKAESIFTLATRIFQQTHFFPLLKMQGHAEEIFITLQTKNKEQIPVLLNAERKVVNGEAILLHIGIVVYNRKKFEDELVRAKKAAEAALLQNTDLIQAKQELQKNMEQLDQQIQVVNKQNEELRQFNHVVTHDLQEPLRKLSLFSNMVLQSEEKEAQKAIVEKLIRVSEQMRSIISGLQQYVWLTETPNKLTTVALSECLLIAQQQVEKEAPDVKLIIEKEALPFIRADGEQIGVLFFQLLSNVIRFRKTGTEAYVKIAANTLLLNSFKNTAEKYRYTRFLKLQLTDSGLGFDAEYKDQVFELFKRLHPESGRGVGLSLCKKIIENHQGTITIDSQPGEGTTITIFLPMETNGENEI